MICLWNAAMVKGAASLCLFFLSNVFGATIQSNDGVLAGSINTNSQIIEPDLESVLDKVQFYLYTRENNDDYVLPINVTDTLRNSTFDSSRPTKVAIHGYDHTYKTEACQLIRTAYLNSSQDVNVICVEWGKLCFGPPRGVYVEAVANVPKVGRLLGQFLDFLVRDGGADISSFHLIGHSLGAHLAAFAANGLTTGNITRISGLDAALPLYGDAKTNHRLDPSDAEVVDCIHTCGGEDGFYKPLGTVDFYPNGGKPVMPGCGLDLDRSCSHAVVVRYFASSVLHTFRANACSTFDYMKNRNCTGPVGYMGDAAITTAGGIYYLETTGSYPYTQDEQ